MSRAPVNAIAGDVVGDGAAVVGVVEAAAVAGAAVTVVEAVLVEHGALTHPGPVQIAVFAMVPAVLLALAVTENFIE